MQIGVTIVDDNQWEPDEEFFLKLTMLQGHGNGEVKLGRTSIMEITILNDDGKSPIEIKKWADESFFRPGKFPVWEARPSG